MAARRFTRRQALENARFVKALTRTGNARLAARLLGVHRSTYFKRRARSAAFAQDWETALAAAHAAFSRAGGERAPEGQGTVTFTRGRSNARAAAPESDCPPSRRTDHDPLRTRGGEATVIRRKGGRLQLRRALPGRMTAEAEDIFLETLAETANIRVAAAAAGFAHTSLIARARRSPQFAARLGAALAEAGPWIAEELRAEREAREEASEAAWEADPRWPEGLTVARALQALRVPPLKLPCTPFPKRKTRDSHE
jgi:hypothetical protein